MNNETFTVDAVAVTSETVNLNEVDTMEESFAAVADVHQGSSN
jgi:hypothetical protein